MSWVTIIWSMVASACLTLAAIHLLVWRARRSAWANLLFALTAVSTAVFAALAPYQPDLLCLAGFMSLLQIPPTYTNRVFNVHPALLPAFGGKGFYGHRVHAAVLASENRLV